jgi:2-polyprenyl-3-methyl-5-hydroxy-6-metoxy-1,4-benzoquinol methylase
VKISLEAFGCWHDSHAKIRTRPACEGGAFTDADRIEERISRIVSHAWDLSLFSPELNRHINDWPTRFHLGASRANILRPFQEQFSGAHILEIGAGCGAITRFLGESGANVMAIEAAARRALIARDRTRDLPNVEVAAGHLDDVDPERRFDFITMIGVLAHAHTLSPSEEPALRMIERARELLKPGGRLIIAAENQLGIKYFAGVPEDHSGRSAYGVEGRYRESQPRTYERRQLLDMVREAGFAGADVLAPFPHYQFPVSIITESGFADGEFDSAALASEWVGHDQQLTSQLAFSPAPAWPIVESNGMALDLSNSFLVVANQSPRSAVDSSILAYHYPSHRSREYRKEVTYVKTGEGSIELRVSVLETDSKPRTQGRFRRFSLSDRCDYVRGIPLSVELTNIIIRDGWKMEEVGSFIKRYLDIVGTLAGKTGHEVQLDNIALTISGRFFDLIPRNIIMGLDGEIHAIDQEWDYAGDIPVGLLVFRALTQLFYAKFRFGSTASEFRHTRIGFMASAFRAAGFEVTEQGILSYAKLEAASQSEVAQRKLTVAEIFGPYLPILFKTLPDPYSEPGEKVRLPGDAPAAKSAELSESIEEPGPECAGPARWANLWRRIRPGRDREMRASRV